MTGMTTNPSPFDVTLLPGAATVDADGRVALAGIDLVELAERFGTPLYVYDEAELRARCREYAAAFGAGAAYASKAFLCVAMARLVAEEGLGLDVATGGELFVALHAGFPPDRIVFHGNNKSDAELRRALEAGVGRIVVDSFAELDRIARLAPARRGRRRRSTCASRPASKRTRTSSSRPAPRTPSSASGSTTAPRSPRSRASSRTTISTSPGSTATSVHR